MVYHNSARTNTNLRFALGVALSTDDTNSVPEGDYVFTLRVRNPLYAAPAQLWRCAP